MNISTELENNGLQYCGQMKHGFKREDIEKYGSLFVRVKHWIQQLLWKDAGLIQVGCFGLASMELPKDHVFSGRRTGDELIKKPILSILFLCLMIDFNNIPNFNSYKIMHQVIKKTKHRQRLNDARCPQFLGHHIHQILILLREFEIE